MVGQNIRLEVVGSMHSAPTTLHVFDHVKPLCKDWPGYPFPIKARRLDDLSSSHHPIGRNVFLGKREPLCSSVDGDQVLPVDEAVFVSKTIGASLTSHTPFRAPNSCPWKCTSRSSLSWLRRHRHQQLKLDHRDRRASATASILEALFVRS